MRAYIKSKTDYHSLHQLGSGSPPFRFLVIGGGDPNLYGEGFFEVGGHESSNYGAGKNWTTDEFWTGLIDHLLDHKMSFDGIIFDPGSFSWIRGENKEEIFRNILYIFEAFLKPNGVIVVEAYNARGTDDDTKYFHEQLMGADALQFAYPGEFRLNDGHTGDVYRIFQKQGGVLPFNNIESIYPVDMSDQHTTVDSKNRSLSYAVGKKHTDEETLKDFLNKRFEQKRPVEQKKICSRCTYENDMNRNLCDICDTVLPSPPPQPPVVRAPKKTCKVCTFDNTMAAPICEVCENPL